MSIVSLQIRYITIVVLDCSMCGPATEAEQAEGLTLVDAGTLQCHTFTRSPISFLNQASSRHVAMMVTF